MNNKVLEFIKSHNMINSGDGIVVGLSGGADSVCLLHLLCSMRDSLDLRVCAAHLNHMLRGEEADRDEQYCVDLCRELGVPLFLKRQDIARLSSERGISFEQCGRDCRYELFSMAAQGGDCNKIATAHTLSDSVETMLFNLMRGTGIKGLCGVPPVRDNIIRPLLCCTRSEIESYCADNDLSYMTDSTNLEDEYSRNYIRHNVVSKLKEKNPSFEQSVYRTINTIRMDADYLDYVAQRFFSEIYDGQSLDAIKLKRRHVAIRTRVLCEFLKLNGFVVDNKTVMSADSVVQKGEGKANLSKGKAIAVWYERVIIVDQSDGSSPAYRPVCEPIAVIDAGSLDNKDRYVALSDERQLGVCKCNKNSIDFLKNINKNLFNNFLNYDMINGNIIARTRLDGDFYRPANRGCTKSLKKLFNEAKIPLNERNRLIVLQDDTGIIWVEGFGADSRVAANEDTENLIGLFIEERLQK